jgi:hypothetical protein
MPKAIEAAGVVAETSARLGMVSFEQYPVEPMS